MPLSSSKKQKLEILDINLSIAATVSPNSKQIKAFICFELGDTVAAIDKFISKISSFCFFDDDRGILSSNLKEIEGELMIVSQFTLAAVTKKGAFFCYRSKGKLTYNH